MLDSVDFKMMAHTNGSNGDLRQLMRQSTKQQQQLDSDMKTPNNGFEFIGSGNAENFSSFLGSTGGGGSDGGGGGSGSGGSGGSGGGPDGSSHVANERSSPLAPFE